MALLLGSIYLLAAASWRYVETPVRYSGAARIRCAFLPAAAGATVAIALFGAFLWHSEACPNASTRPMRN